MADEQRNAEKVSILEGDSIIEDLIAISFYDSKPVHFLSSTISEIKWNIVSKIIFSKNLDKKVLESGGGQNSFGDST